MSETLFKLTAHLCSPLAGDPPQLDSMLEWVLSKYTAGAVEHHKVTRALPAPPIAAIGIPILRRTIGGWEKARCSDPILPAPPCEWVDHVNKRIAVEAVGLLAPSARTVVSTTNSWTKSYRLPMRIRSVPQVVWFAAGSARETRRLLQKNIHAIGHKISIGYGRVVGWETEHVSEDRSWFADTEHAPLLMATLPMCDELPSGLIGARRSFGACVAPYWHPERFTEIVEPC